MALFIEGMKCNICGQPICKNQSVTTFPAFVSNSCDPIFMFSDSVFHSECFRKHDLSKKVQERYNEFKEKTGLGKRFCSLCEQEVMTPDDYLWLGHLTDDMQSSLFKYNYKHYHKSCLERWEGVPKLCNMLNELQESGNWCGNGLKWLIEVIRKLTNQ